MSIEFTPQPAEIDPHADEIMLDRYLLDQLDGAAVAALEEHLFMCEACRGRLEASEEFIRAFRTAIARFPASH